jgi:dolichyl-phosphate beta-glucosyltransferase
MPDVCLVVPCFNEAKRLDSAALLAGLMAQPRLGLYFVNDGSEDDTPRALRELAAKAPGRVTVIDLDRNYGKAEAVRRGMLKAVEDSGHAFVGFWDADLSTPLSEVTPFIDTLERHVGAVAAIGSRWRRLGANIDRLVLRHVLGRIFATLASMTLDLPVYDSQCGAKLFKAAVVPELFGETFRSTWCFDVEILARLSARLGTSRTRQAVIEIPLTAWSEVGGSKLRLAQMAMMPLELWQIRMRYSPRP